MVERFHAERSFVENIDIPAESVIIAHVSEHIDPDGAMMQASPVDRLAEAKRKAMELYRKVAQ